ncbi:MAG: hypothetical protein JW715_07185 [Sedimentisphaerales bacterium]|nr:hypothetical protein [Sedimentisphaerales bacterium]
MDEKLDFSLPQNKQKISILPIISIVLLIVLIGLTLINILIISNSRSNLTQDDLSFSSDQVKQLALKLSDRNLYTEAAKVWRDYLSNGHITTDERAKTLFQIGTLLEKAGSYEEAIEYFYRSEITSELAELEPQINIHLKNCFEKLGMFSALRYELMDRTSLNKDKQAGGKVVAEIGTEKITDADLDALIEETIDSEIAPMSWFTSAEQQNEQKRKMLEHYKAPAARAQFLKSWLAQEVLYRNALEQELPEEPKVKKMIEEVNRSVLSQQLMSKELADKINVTETDLQTYYQANKDKFVEPPDEEDPNSLARQKSFDEVRDQVASELISRKSQDVRKDFIEQMMNKYNVIIHTSVLGGAEQTTTEDKSQ